MSDPIPIVIAREDVNDDFVYITKWLVADQSSVEKGQPIVEIETSKANAEITAPVSGFIRHAHREGEEVEVGKVLGYLIEQESDLAKEMVPDIAQSLVRAQGGISRFSRQASELIKEWELDPSQFENIGLVRSQDVLRYIRREMLGKKGGPAIRTAASGSRGAPVPAAGIMVRTEKLSRNKRLEAKYMWSAYQNTLPSAVTVRCSASQLHDIAEKETGLRANVAAIVVFEVARLLRKYPVFNAYYAAECVNYYEAINIGFAIDAGQGLKVPVICEADKKSVADIASEMQELLVQYLEGKISTQSMSGGTFTVTDLSGEHVHSFQPLINQGQSAILAICSESEEVESQEKVFNLVLVFDHQLSEGRQAARFLNELRQQLEAKGKTFEKATDRLASTPSKNTVALPRSATEQTLAGIWRRLFGLDRIDIHDNFLELGGHSLLATELLFQMNKAFQVDLPLRSLFETPTVAGLAALINQRRGKTSDHIVLPAIDPDPDHKHQPFPLTDVQQAYWIGRGDSFELGNVACHIYAEIEFPGFDQTRFELALYGLIQRHDMLRAIVLADGTQQILDKVPPYHVEVLDLRGQNPQFTYSRLEEVRERMSHQVLPSDRWPLFDIRACLLDTRRAQLHVSLDFLILDARSIRVLIQEFTQLYRDPEVFLAPLQISFRDYVRGEIAFQNSDGYRRSENYWKERVPLLPPPPELPLAKNPSSVKRPRFVRRSARLELETWSRLKKRVTKAGLTAPSILLAAFAEILSVWSKSPRFTLNITLFNRLPLHPQVNDLVGDFTSLTMLAVDNSNEVSFEARAQRIQEQLWSDLDHRYFSGVRVLRELARIQRDSQRTSMPVVFTSFLNLETFSHDASGPGLGTITYSITQTPQVWLDNIVHEEAGVLVCSWDAVEELFPGGLLDDMFSSYHLLLRQLASDDSAWQRSLHENTQNLIPRNQLELRENVNNATAPPSDELLHTLFLKQVEVRPGQIAVRTPQKQLTYAELYQRACKIEEELLQRGVEPNQLIAIMMEKSWEQIVGVLGIHFAGGAYLPVDTELPAERQRYLLEHGQIKIVLAQSAVQHRLNVPAGVEVLAIDRFKATERAPLVPRRRQVPEDLAYVIYTSGSTGLPKGVMIDHRGAVNTVQDINQRFGISDQDRILALSRLSFDLSVYDIFGMLAAGGTIVMPTADRAWDAEHWAELIEVEKITVWNTVPALMQMLVEQCASGERIGQSLRLVMMSGDWVPVGLPGQIRQLAPAAEIVSLGGATEASIWSILYPIKEVYPDWKSIPYGRPMLNQSFHVLNETLGPSPVWVPGHLYIGGIGLAKGYWRDEQRTASSFIKHPLTGERLYRTGDLGRYLPDGNIEFLGRDDFQVKVQGHRIELGEIEFWLQEHEAVESCVVAVHEVRPQEKTLVAYTVLKRSKHLEPNDLREHLREKLPEYMVPSAFVFLDRLPLTANGKVDRKALPQPVNARPENSISYTAPRDHLELQLTRLWEKVLDFHPVRLSDNFFDLGGNSLLAARLFSEVRKLTGRNLPLSTVFVAPTVRSLAGVLRKDGWSPSWSSLVPIQPMGSKPPFFCVHGAGGNVLLFHDLARDLGQDYPFYGLQSQGLDGSKKYLRSVEDMAAHYLDEIRELRPEGPYYLGGYCLGGSIAFEMAQRLRNDGQQIALLVMIDSYNFNGIAPRLSLGELATLVREKIEFQAANLLELDLKSLVNYLGKKMRIACARELERMTVLASNLVKKVTFNQRKQKFEIFLEQLNEKANFAYVPDIYPGKVTLFKSRQDYSYLRDATMKWGDLATGGLEIIELPVQHGGTGIFLEPYVRVLAEKLRICIDLAGQESNFTP